MLILYTEEIKSKPGILRISPFQVAVSDLHIHTVFHKVLLVYYDLIYLTFRKKHKACVLLQQLIRENQRKKKKQKERDRITNCIRPSINFSPGKFPWRSQVKELPSHWGKATISFHIPKIFLRPQTRHLFNFLSLTTGLLFLILKYCQK